MYQAHGELSFVLRLCALTHHVSLHHFLIFAIYFRFNALWLVYLHLFEPFFWEYSFLFTPNFSGTQIG